MAPRCAPPSTDSIVRLSRKCPIRPCSPRRAMKPPRHAPPDPQGKHRTMKHAAFSGRLVMLGFGSIGQGVLPLILKHIDMPKDRIEIVTSDDRGIAIAAEYGIAHT